MPNDLTWAQVNEAFLTPPISISQNTIVIDTSLVLGEPVTALSEGKVVEFCYKLLLACNRAQKNVNAPLTTNLLSSFPSPFYSSVNDPESPTSPPTMDATVQCIARIPLDINLASGSISS